jgi:hypothetical protein
MGDIVKFRTRRLTGFIPDEVGIEAKTYRDQQKRARDLVVFARSGQPQISDVPDDCA